VEVILAAALLVVALVVIGAAFLASRVALGPEEAAVLFRLGRTAPGRVVRGGTHYVIPIVDRAARVGLATVTTEVATAATTSEGAALDIDVTLAWRVVDPYLAVLNVVDVAAAVREFTGTAARETVAGHSRTALVSDPAGLTRSIAARLPETFERWGVAVETLSASARDAT
jgi:regulator of protease activity HflC (stomatin/prohibitin superfamily)